ncbi:NADP-dependent glyceraldehyde-3-phosphate dehydrogenase, putative [Ricinus communis]|uniref:NADP-dependent glyceraldehyde-3-phosphate dehydrogenase n=1 Tax=Ricinus communis TaxID=3988 RepID=B9TK98_RICCO|nr:NADP-dependent glyceraldehyde-3-phosphate dehydrogenase, putative [Ricinus communis]
MELAKSAEKAWARTPLWKIAELLHKAAAILKEHKAPNAECLVKEIAKLAKDAFSELQYNCPKVHWSVCPGVSFH